MALTPDRTVLAHAALAHAETWRPYTLFHVGLVGLTGATLSTDHPEPLRLLGAWAVPTLGWLAGLYGGDYFDRELDALAKPYRPIPSGRMRAGTALGCMIAATILGTLLGALLNWRTVVVAGAALVLAIAYSKVLKARGLSGNVARGVLTAFAFLFGAMACVPVPPTRLFAVAVVFWAHDAGSNLVGTLRDIDGDRAGGYATLPVRRGVRFSVVVAGILCLVWTATAACAPYLLHRWTGVLAHRVLLATAVGMALAAFAVILRQAPGQVLGPSGQVSRRSALRAHEVLVVERLVVTSCLLALGLPILAVAVVLGLSAAATWWAQVSMRDRYEFGPPAVVNQLP